MPIGMHLSVYCGLVPGAYDSDAHAQNGEHLGWPCPGCSLTDRNNIPINHGHQIVYLGDVGVPILVAGLYKECIGEEASFECNDPGLSFVILADLNDQCSIRGDGLDGGCILTGKIVEHLGGELFRRRAISHLARQIQPPGEPICCKGASLMSRAPHVSAVRRSTTASTSAFR